MISASNSARLLKVHDQYTPKLCRYVPINILLHTRSFPQSNHGLCSNKSSEATPGPFAQTHMCPAVAVLQHTVSCNCCAPCTLHLEKPRPYPRMMSLQWCLPWCHPSLEQDPGADQWHCVSAACDPMCRNQMSCSLWPSCHDFCRPECSA